MEEIERHSLRFLMMPRYTAPYRDTKEAIENVRFMAPTAERVSLAQLAKVEVKDGASEIYREANSR
jgi:cobalt-zinc-cadmium resistance protein CzcA